MIKALFLLCLLAIAAHAQNNSIRISFHNDTDTRDGMTSRPEGGLVRTTRETWNNVTSGGGGLTQNDIPLLLSDGTTSGATLSVKGNDARNAGIDWQQNSQDWVMMQGLWSMNNSSFISLSDLPAEITEGGYFITIFGDSADNRTMNFYRGTATTPLLTIHDQPGVFTGAFLQGTNFASSARITDSSPTIVVDTATNGGGRLSFVQGIIIGPLPDVPGPPAPDLVAQSGGFWDQITWSDGSSPMTGDLAENASPTVTGYTAVTYRGIPADETVAALSLGKGGDNPGQGVLRVQSGDLRVTGDLVVGTGPSPNDSFLHLDGGSLTVGGDASFGRGGSSTDGSLIIGAGTVNIGGDLSMGGYSDGAAMLRFHNPGSAPAVQVGGTLDLERCSLDLTFDSGYSHAPGSVIPIATYQGRRSQFRNFRQGEEFNCGRNRFRIDYDVIPNTITLTALENWPVPANRPNIVLILADDQGYTDNSLNGNDKFPMPNVDSIAAAGVRFTNAYVSGGVCHPTRCGILTGRYQERVGSENNLGGPNYNGMPVSERTLARRLQGLGYHTAAVGKWHLGYNIDFHPNNRGFHRWYGMRAGSRSFYNSTSENSVFNDQTTPDFAGELADPNDYLTDRIGDKVVQIIDDHLRAPAAADPFFIYMSFTDVHSPVEIRTGGGSQARDPRFIRLENEFGLTAASYQNSPYLFAPDGGDGPGSPAEQSESLGARSQAEVDAKRYQLAAMTLAMDENVGKVLQKLEEEDIADHTIVLYLNDNGGAGANRFGGNYSYNAPLIGYKGEQAYEGTLRVPCAIRWPAMVPAGQVIDEPVISLDFGATFVNAGDGVPAEARNGLDGLDLKPLLTAGTPLPADRVLTWRNGGTDNGGSAARMGDWKLRYDEFIHRDGSVPPKLFHLSTDPTELIDLAAARPEIYRKLRARFESWEAGLLAPLYGPSTVDTDSGLIRWPIPGGLILRTDSPAPKFLSAAIRTPVSTTSDFSFSFLARASENGPYPPGAGLWGALGDGTNRNNFIRFGIDFAESRLRIFEGKSGSSGSIALASLPVSDFATVTVSHSASTGRITLSSSLNDVRTTISLAGSYGPLTRTAIGASNIEGEVTVLRPRSIGGNDAEVTLDGPPGAPALRLDVPADGPFEPYLERSTDLRSFTGRPGTLVENLGGGAYRITAGTSDPIPDREFYRLRTDRR